MKGSIYPRWALWHGLIDGWPALRLSSVDGDLTWKKGSGVSIIRKVALAIDEHVGISYGDAPSIDQIQAAYSRILSIEGCAATNSFTKYYESLPKGSALAGTKRQHDD